MKTLFLTLVLAVMLMSGSALKCNKCYGWMNENCKPVPETCQKHYVCASYDTEVPLFFVMQREQRKECVSPKYCQYLKKIVTSNVKCCDMDFCN